MRRKSGESQRLRAATPRFRLQSFRSGVFKEGGKPEEQIACKVSMGQVFQLFSHIEAVCACAPRSDDGRTMTTDCATGSGRYGELPQHWAKVRSIRRAFIESSPDLMSTPLFFRLCKASPNRKNWLFAGHPNRANAATTLYGLIETAKACGLDPYQYFRFLFSKLPYARTEQDYRALLPQNLTPEVLSRFMAGQ